MGAVAPTTREQAIEILRFGEQGVSHREIARLTGTSRSLVQLTLTERTDTYLDRVAIDRALAGDWRVKDNLTYWEQQEVTKIIMRRGGWNTKSNRRVYEMWAKRDPKQARVVVPYYGDVYDDAA